MKIEKEIVHIKSSNKNKLNILVNNNNCSLSIKYVLIFIVGQENARNIPTVKNNKIGNILSLTKPLTI